MTITRRLALALAVASFLQAAPARAALLTIDGGELHQTPESFLPGWWGGNDVFGAQPGYVGGQLTFTGLAGERYRFTVEFVGYEAQWIDAFQSAGGDLTNRIAPGSSVAFSLIASGGSDVVPFSFLSGAPTPLSVDNGSNLSPPPYRPCGAGTPDLCLPNIFLSIANSDLTGGTEGRSGPVAWLALDDNGAGPDTDHDDWVGLVRITAVPEPASTLLFGTGVVAAAARLRRRAREGRASGRLERHDLRA